MLSLAIVSLSPCSAAISSSTGATILHGPHHSAQKSTSTGLSLPSTSLAKVASVTVLVLPAMVFSSLSFGGGVSGMGNGIDGLSMPRVPPVPGSPALARGERDGSFHKAWEDV